MPCAPQPIALAQALNCLIACLCSSLQPDYCPNRRAPFVGQGLLTSPCATAGPDVGPSVALSWSTGWAWLVHIPSCMPAHQVVAQRERTSTVTHPSPPLISAELASDT